MVIRQSGRPHIRQFSARASGRRGHDHIGSVLTIPRNEAMSRLRAALHASFPTTRFVLIVGEQLSCVCVRWFDGPTLDEVDAVTELYAGLTLDEDDNLAEKTSFAIVNEELALVRYDLGFIISDRQSSRQRRQPKSSRARIGETANLVLARRPMPTSSRLRSTK